MLPSEIRELWEGRGRKTEIRDRGDGRKQCLPDTSPQRLWQLAQGLHRIKPDGVQCLEWGNGHDLPSWTKKLSPIDKSLERENYFSLMASHCVYKSHLRAGPPCPAVLGQHTHTQSQWCFFLNFCFILLCKSIVYLSDLLPIYYVFRVCIFTDSVFMCGSCALSLSFFFLPSFLPPSVCLFF